MKTARPGIRCLEQRIESADELPIGGDVDREDIVPVLRLDVAERRRRGQQPGVADQHVELAVTLVEREREPAMPSKSFMSSGTKVAVPPPALILSSSSSKPADRARRRDDMRAGLRKLQCERAPMPREAPVTSAIRSERGFDMRER